MHLYEKNKPLTNFISGNDLVCLQCCNFTHKDGQINYLMFKKVRFGELFFFFKEKGNHRRHLLVLCNSWDMADTLKIINFLKLRKKSSIYLYVVLIKNLRFD